jgi:choline dehydrogenase-like flavoprotein
MAQSTTISSAGEYSQPLHRPSSSDQICRGGTSGSVLAARLAEDPNTSVLVIEAGQHNSVLENTIMVGGW